MTLTSKDTPMLKRFALLAVSVLMLAGCPTGTAPEPTPPAPQIVSFVPSATRVAAGEQVTLSWKTQDATHIELRDAELGLLSGVDPARTSGEVTVNVPSDRLFVLTASNEAGVRASAAVLVQAEGARAVLFVAAPPRVSAGEEVVLAWSADGAKNVSVKTAAGEVLDVHGQTASGTLQHAPVATTTYLLTVDGAEFEAHVEVAASVDAAVATPSPVQAGQDLTLSWKTTGATKVLVSTAGGVALHEESEASKVADGSYVFAVPTGIDPGTVLSFVVRAETADGTATSAPVSVYVGGAPAITTWDVPQYVPLNGEATVSWKTVDADVVQVLRDGVAVFVTPDAASAKQGSLSFPVGTADVSFQLRALDSRGALAVSEEKVVDPVGLPTVTLFSATPQPGIQNGGEPVTLTWDIPEARNVKIVAEGQYQVTEVTGEAAVSGTVTTYPNKETTYRIEADNGLGDEIVPATADVTVASPASFTIDPPTAPAGATVTITGHTAVGGGEVVGLPITQKNVPGDAFIDISTTGVDINYSGPDFTAKEVTLPEVFTTRIFGQTVSTDELSISINGWFTFAASSVSLDVATPLPTTALEPNTVAPFFEDLYDTSTSEIFYQLDTVDNERRLIVQWDKVEYDPVAGSQLTFQAQVYESGKIVFAYQSVQAAATGNPAIGVQDSTETVALNAPGGFPADGDTVRFFGRTSLPASWVVSDAPLVARVMIGADHFLDIEQAYPVMPPGQFTVAEVSANPSPGVTDGQWFEVVNTSGQPFDLTGFVLEAGGSAHAIANGTTLPANGRMVFGQSADAGDGIAVDYVYGNSLVIPAGGTLEFSIANAPYASMTLPQASFPAGYSWQAGPVAAGMTTAPGVTDLECVASSGSSYGSNGQHGTPGAPNTACPGYSYAGAIPANFEPIALTGTQVAFGSLDDGSATITPPVPVVFDGVRYASITVSTNGYVSLLPMTCDQYCWSTNKAVVDPSPSSSALPPYGFIAPYWDDNDLSVHGGVYWERKEPGLQPNDGYLIVSWENVHHYVDPNDPADTQASDDLNFQVKFFDTGDVEFHFGTFLGEDGSGGTTWFEHPSGKAAFIVNVNSSTSPGIASNTAFRLAAL